jgi:hypothetical protein
MPIATLLLPVVKGCAAFAPIAVFEIPVAKFKHCIPTAVFPPPVVVAARALYPTAVFWVAVVDAFNA